MAPRKTISRLKVLAAAALILRENGEDAITARAIAARLGCSIAPVFSNFGTMDNLRAALTDLLLASFTGDLRRAVKEGRYPPYKATGMEYVALARREPNVFRFLFMNDRGPDLAKGEWGAFSWIPEIVGEEGYSAGGSPSLFHFEMWSLVHGIAAMIATGYYDPGEELTSRTLTDVFSGLRSRFEEGGSQ